MSSNSSSCGESTNCNGEDNYMNRWESNEPSVCYPEYLNQLGQLMKAKPAMAMPKPHHCFKHDSFFTTVSSNDDVAISSGISSPIQKSIYSYCDQATGYQSNWCKQWQGEKSLAVVKRVHFWDAQAMGAQQSAF